MDSALPRPLAVARAEVLLAAVVAGCAAVAVAALAPPGGDAAAHLYRTELLQAGVHGWDTLWFGGHYPFTSYSLLYYVPAAVVGNVPLVVAAAVASAALFAALAADEWGDAARWPVRAFAFTAAIPVFTGTYSYAVGAAVALGALRSLQLGHPVVGAFLAAATLGFSPLAFAFLTLALAAALFVRRRLDRAALTVMLGVGVAAALQLALLRIFESDGRYPYSPTSLAGVVAVAGLGSVLAARTESGRLLAAFFLVWGFANVTAFVVPSPFGDNLARLRYVVFPLMLLAVALARGRPRPLVVAALAVALVYNVGPDVSALPKRIGDAPTAEHRFWQPALAFLREHSRPGERVEVVPTFGHWEAWFVPRAGFPLARGWFRQLDIAQNPELYRDRLAATTYRQWLRRSAVRYVLLPRARLGPLGASREAALLRSGRSGLALVERRGAWTFYELRHPASPLEGPAPAAVTAMSHDRVDAWAAAGGVYDVHVRYTPLWQARGTAACISRGPRGQTRVLLRGAGRFSMRASAGVAPLAAALRGPVDACAGDVSERPYRGK